MQTVDIVISGGVVLTVDDLDTVLSPGSIAVQKNKIVAVGSCEEIDQHYAGLTRIDASNRLVMPGLVNGHTHAAMTCFRGIADDLTLMDWLNNYIFPAEARNVNPELVYRGSLLACAEMIKSGTTTFCDMYIFEDETARAAKEAGMRCLVGEVLFDFPSPNFQTPSEGLAYTEMLLKKWAHDPLVGIIVQPHSLYTCSPGLLKDAKRLADRYGAPMGTHFLENMAESLELKEKLGQKAVTFLKNKGILDDRFIAFHAVCLDDEDLQVLAGYGCKVIHNPESNMKLASGIAPVQAMLSRGITVGLGTDGCASNNNLDMFQEMDSAAKLGKIAKLDPTAMPAKEVIRMATIGSARALGVDKMTGSLEAGKQADIVLIDLQQPHLTPLYNPCSHVVYTVGGADVETVMIAGRIVMENRKLLTIDEKEAMRGVNHIAEGIKKSLGNGENHCG
jgi:5-methylthioadenosine/S-adenosylhomocysteine deaminase